MTAPTIEERLTAAAFQILTDGRRHSVDAVVWAQRFMGQAAYGRSTAFQRRLFAQWVSA
jgi:hypothetical protein